MTLTFRDFGSADDSYARLCSADNSQNVCVSVSHKPGQLLSYVAIGRGSFQQPSEHLTRFTPTGPVREKALHRYGHETWVYPQILDGVGQGDGIPSRNCRGVTSSSCKSSSIQFAGCRTRSRRSVARCSCSRHYRNEYCW